MLKQKCTNLLAQHLIDAFEITFCMLFHHHTTAELTSGAVIKSTVPEAFGMTVIDF